MSNAAAEAVIQEYCRELKLAAVVRDYPGLCRRARDGGSVRRSAARTARSRDHQSPSKHRAGC